MQLHDHHYRNLFRHPAMVRALFEGIIVEPWVAAPNLASLLFQLEHSPDIAQTQGLLHTLQDMLSTPQADELRRAFGAWVRHVLMPRAAPKDAKLPNTTEFSEVIDMLTTGYKNWSRQWWLEGLEQGREEGREEGAAALLLRLLERKFGPLDAQIKARVEQASLADREAWSLNLLDARSLDEVFAVDAGDAST